MKKFRIVFMVFLLTLTVASLFSTLVLADENDDGKYIVSQDSNPSDINRFDKLSDATIFISNQPADSYTITLTEDDTDMGLWGGVPNGFRVTLKSEGNNQFTITNRNVSDTTNSLKHFSQVAGELTLENIILDGGNVGGGIVIMPSISSSTATLIMKDGAVIQNCVDVLNPGSAVNTVGTNANFVMDGGIIRNNQAQNNGGAINISSGNKFTMNDGLITGNTSVTKSGGGVLVHGEFIMNGGEISYNKAPSQYGGGVGVGSNGKITIDNGTIQNNSATFGGGLYIDNSNESFSIKDANISYNTATKSGGGIYSTSGLTINNSTLGENNAEVAGGGIAMRNALLMNSVTFTNNSGNEGGALFLRKPTSTSDYETTIANSSFLNNNAKFGGAIEVWDVLANINTSNFLNNTATSNGGGIYVYDIGSINVSNNTKFENNVATKLGGAIYTYNLDYDNPIDSSAYQNVTLDSSSVFNGNKAEQVYLPPINAMDFTNLQFSSTSLPKDVSGINRHILNNYDVNYQNEDNLMTIYTVTYNANGGNGNYIEKALLDYNYIFKSDKDTNISKENYHFTSWNTKADGTGIKYLPSDTLMLSSDMTLYAQWEKNSTTTTTPTQNVDNPTKLENSSIPKTGDNTHLVSMIMLMSGSLLIVGYLIYRKRELYK